MQRVYCLYRVSTTAQSLNDDTPMQRIACRNFAEQRKWRITKEFVEIGISGFKKDFAKRDALNQIIHDAELGAFDILLVYMTDRIGRKRQEVPVVINTLIASSVQIWSCSEGQILAKKHADHLVNFIRAWQSEGESILTSQRVKAAISQLKEQQRYYGGIVPYGYSYVCRNDKTHSHFMIDTATQHVVKAIFTTYVNKAKGCDRIADMLNQQGILSPRQKKWGTSSVKYILHNPIYTGILKNGSHDESLQIITQEQFDSAQERLKGNSRKYTKHTEHAAREFSSVMFCGCCGAKMRLKTTTKIYAKRDGTSQEYKTRYYVCADKNDILHLARHVRASDVDDNVMDAFLKTIQHISKTKPSQISFAGLKEKIRIAAMDLRATQSEMEKLLDMSKRNREKIMAAIMEQDFSDAENLEQEAKTIEQRAMICEDRIIDCEIEYRRRDSEYKSIRKAVRETLNAIATLCEKSKTEQTQAFFFFVEQIIVSGKNDIALRYATPMQYIVDNSSYEDIEG